MPVVIPTGFSQITLVHEVPGSHGEVDVVWGIENSDTEAADLEAVMTVWQQEIVEQFFTDNVTFVLGRSLRGPRPGGPTLELLADPLLPTQGQQGNTALPINNAVLLSLVTGLGGVRFRGRKYMPGIPEQTVDNEGNLDPASQAQFQTAVDAFFAAFPAAGPTLVLLHGTGISATPAPTPLTDIRVQRKMATQRTRLRG